MDKKVAAAGVVVLAGGVIAFGFVRKQHAHTEATAHPESQHGNGMDNAMAAARAMYAAPAGSTPCETAYIAFKASEDVADQTGAKAVVLKLAPHDDFIRLCNALPPAAQTCMPPAYLVKHHDECEKVKPQRDAIKPMVEYQPVADWQVGEETH